MELSVIDYTSPYYTQVTDLRNRILRIPLGLNLFDENLNDDKNQYIIIILKDEKVLACVMLSILDKETVKVRQMAVESDKQGQGYGTLLMRYAENFCVLNDYFILELHARITAKTFYEKLGYDTVGREFEEVSIPHIKMVKQLPITRL